MEQPQYNLLHRMRVEIEYARLYEDIGLGLTTYSPLASGALTGKYLDGVPSDSRAALPGYEWLSGLLTAEATGDVVRKTKAIADDLGCSVGQLAIAWCTKNPRASTVITGASRVAQVHENMAAIEVADRLDAEWMARIEREVPFVR
jgi:aryl-alcohol dehydrogenase-like predicted oxidoreductase